MIHKSRARLSMPLLITAILAACSSGTTISFRDSDRATIGDYDVKWADASALEKRDDGLSMLNFIITPVDTENGKPASLQDRQRLAQAALATKSRCQWERFDPALNAQYTAMMGGAEHVMFALARCR